MPFRRSLLLAVTAACLVGCRVIDVRVDPHRTGVNSDAMIEGYATFGFADDPSLFYVDVLDGRSAGAVFYLELWYLARLELGLVGIAAGVGPVDVGIGTLFYHPRSPAAPRIENRWDLDAPREGEEPSSPRPSRAGEGGEARRAEAEAGFDDLDEAVDP